MDAELADQFAAMGHKVEAPPPPADPEVFEVQPSNGASVNAWLAVQTQWRGSGLNLMGLDYVAVDVVLRRTGAPDRVFEDLQLMEFEALAAFSEMADER